MKFKKENIIIFVLLLISISSFFIFGLFHITKFETTDEHLWKYGRIKQYWQALEDKDWKKTYINDKPGITVALISGIGLFSEPNPEEKEKIKDPKITQKGLFEKYDATQSQKVNFAFRLPILIFSDLSFLLFFWLILRAFKSSWLALLAVMLMTLNPILLGISQVINPDSFFWIFSGLSIFSFFALLNTSEKKFLVLCGIFTGFALLSKYTAGLLFGFYLIAIFSKIIFQDYESAKKTDYRKFLAKQLVNIFIIFFLSIVIFSLFLPAVFLNPDYLFRGFSQFITGPASSFKGISEFISWKNFILVILLGASACALVIRKKNILGSAANFMSRQKKIILILICSLFSLVLLFSLLNVWTGQKIIPFDALRDAAYINEPKEFNFKPLLADESDMSKKTKLFLMESYPFFFSLSPIIVFLIFFISVKSFAKKISDENAAIIFSVLSFSLIYFFSTLLARVVANVRYSIMLYPLFAILGAIAIMELSQSNWLKKFHVIFLFSLFILILGLWNFWSIRPFYFSYASFLLPKEFSIHDSWGHGSFEAAQYLNAFPGAKEKIIWSNSDTVCRFFEGKCLRNRRIDLGAVSPDYFVISKRGELKISNRFLLMSPLPLEKNSDYYFEKLKSNYEWQILINGRPDNFIKIIKFEK